MKIVFDLSCLEYKVRGHPESPERVLSAYQYLKSKGYEFLQPAEFSEELVLNVHSRELLEKVKEGNFFDPDTPRIRNIYFYVCLAWRSAVTALKLAEEEGEALSLMRPPGHHAGRNFLGGFCYLNNIAIASGYALARGKKVAILDLDAHHGNGTQDIFWGKENIIYLSLHQAPLFPGTGLNSEENVYNFPLPAGTRDQIYLEKLAEAVEIIEHFKPDILGISLGLDTYSEDPLTGFLLTQDCYQKIGRKLSKFKPCFFVLEGGYTNKIGELLYSILSHL